MHIITICSFMEKIYYLHLWTYQFMPPYECHIVHYFNLLWRNRYLVARYTVQLYQKYAKVTKVVITKNLVHHCTPP
jgi:hypothetical protein